MSSTQWRHSNRRADGNGKAGQQISVGFLPPIAEFITIVARTRGTTTSLLLSETIATLVGEAEKNPDVIGQDVRSYQHRLPEIIAGERHVHDTTPPATESRPGPQPQYTKRLSGYLTDDLSTRLDDLCASTGIGRARMVRLAVDKYLFDEIVAVKLRHHERSGSRG